MELNKTFMNHPNFILFDIAQGGERYRFKFENGYGASVVRNKYSYGNERGFYELAVLKDDCICYDTWITNDVVGFITSDNVLSILEEIKELKETKE